jgi:ankyrin repeat protein
MKVRFRAFALCTAIVAVVLSGYGWCDSAADRVIAQIFDGNTTAAIASLRDVKDIDAGSSIGLTILIAYAMVPGLNDAALEHAILSRNPNVESKDANGIGALYHAAEQDKIDLILELLRRGANPNAVSDWGSPLVAAASNSRTKTALRLVEVPGLKVDLADRYGRTALIFASIHADSALVKALLEHGANPNIYEPLTGKSPLLWAASAPSQSRNAAATIGALLDKNADARLVNPFTCDSAMHAAVGAQNEASVRLLIERHVRADLANSKGVTPLGLARRLGSDQIRQEVINDLQAEHRNVEDAANPPPDCRNPALTTLARSEPQPSDTTLPDQTPLARAVIAQWSSGNHIVLDPKLADGINKQITFFYQIDCYKGNDSPSVRACFSLLSDKRRLADILVTDLNETFLQHRNPIPWFAARLSSSIGVDFTRAGYGDAYRGRNTTSCGEIPGQYRLEGAYLVSDNNLVEIPGGSRLCLPDGIYTVVLPASSRRVVLRFASAQTPRVSVSSVSPIGSRSDVYGRHVTVPLNLQCLNETSKLNPLTVPLPRRDDISIPKPQLFSTGPVLSVEIKDPSHLCNSTCTADMRVAIVASIMAWKSLCSRCTLANLMVIRFGQISYVNSQTVSILEGFVASNRPLPRPEERLQQLANGPTSYDLMDDSLPKLATVCKSNPAQPFGELCGHYAAINEMPLTIEISNKEDTCGSAIHIACASPDGVVQLRATDHVFLVNTGDSSSPRFGNGDKVYDLSAVLVHEFGHFFGVPHIADQTTASGSHVDAMTPHYDRRFCVTKADSTMLDQATDPRWPFRLDGCAGLTARPR